MKRRASYCQRGQVQDGSRSQGSQGADALPIFAPIVCTWPSLSPPDRSASTRMSTSSAYLHGRLGPGLYELELASRHPCVLESGTGYGSSAPVLSIECFQEDTLSCLNHLGVRVRLESPKTPKNNHDDGGIVICIQVVGKTIVLAPTVVGKKAKWPCPITRADIRALLLPRPLFRREYAFSIMKAASQTDE